MPRKKQSRSSSGAGDAPQSVRLQRFLAAAGFGSRRSCEELIVEGRVEVDGEVVDQLGSKIDPQRSRVAVDGEAVRPPRLRYFLVNKPVGVVTTHRDPQGRPRVIDLVPGGEKLFPVGRLDRSSEGLILLTNDGDLAQHLAHPRYGVEKVYHVTVAGQLPPDVPAQLRKGVRLAEGFARAERARIRSSRARMTELEIVLREGKNREIRRMLAGLGHKVQRLRRIAFGPLRLGDVPTGAHRELTRDEVERLRRAGRREETPSGVGKKPGKGGVRGASRKKDAGKSPRRERPDRRPEELRLPKTLDAPTRSRSVIGDETRAPEPKRKRTTKKQSAKPRTTKSRPATGRSSKKGPGQKRSAKRGRR